MLTINFEQAVNAVRSLLRLVLALANPIRGWIQGSRVGLISLGLILALTLGLTTPALTLAAPDPTPSPEQPAPTANGPGHPQPDADDIPSEMVNRFVQAYLDVVALIDQQESHLQRAETETESRQIQQEIQSQAITLIEDSGLTLQSYWELLALANADPSFRERVLAQVEEANL